MAPEDTPSDAQPTNGGDDETKNPSVDSYRDGEVVKDEPTHGTSGFQKLGESEERPTSAEVEAKRESELAAARDEHNQRSGGGGTVADRRERGE